MLAGWQCRGSSCWGLACQPAAASAAVLQRSAAALSVAAAAAVAGQQTAVLPQLQGRTRARLIWPTLSILLLLLLLHQQRYCLPQIPLLLLLTAVARWL